MRNGSAFALRLFGRFEAHVNGMPVPTRHSRHEHLLLARLTLEQGNPLRREAIAAQLWIEDDYSSYRIAANLRRTLTNVRKSVDTEAWRLPDPRAMARALNLDLSGADVDVIEFDRLTAGNDPARLERAVSLYRGPLLMEYTETLIRERQPCWLWILEERRKRQLAFRKAATEWSVHAQMVGDYSLAAERLRMAIAADPHWQPGYRLCMESLIKLGQRQEAMTMYNSLCRLLRKENQAGPGTDIVALYERIRRAPRTTAAVPSQIKKRPPVKGNLPVASTRFVARENEVAQIIAYLQSQRLVTLTGTGGVGKTRLSLHIAEELSAGFPDGAWFIDLSALNAGAVEARVAAAVGDAFRPAIVLRENEPLVSLTMFLGDRIALLILDNCEHLVEAVRPVVMALLHTCPGVRILATSRQPLGIPGEVRWHVPSLLAPDPRRLSYRNETYEEYVRDFPATTLFLARAEAARPGFDVNAENAQAVAEICYRLDGIPLAIELAAARLQSVGIRDLVTSLDDLFAADASGHRLPRERHRTLHCLMDWSYNLLSEAERRLLTRVAVFRGGWTLESASAVCSDPTLSERQMRSLLTQLVEKSLAVFEEVNGMGRYRLLETVRQYALENLAASGESAECRDRHLAFFADLAECAEPQLRGGDQRFWYQRLDAENENIRAALQYSVGGEAEGSVDEQTMLGLKLASALWHFWEMRSVHAEGYRWLCAALRGSTGRGITHARALIVAAVVADDFCEGSLMLSQVEEGVALSRQSESGWWAGFGLLILGWVYRPLDRERTMEYVNEGLNLAREEGDPWLVAFACHVVAYQEIEAGNLAVARGLLGEALLQVRHARDMWMLEETVYLRGLTACADGAEEEALDHLNECLTLQSDFGTRTRSATARYFKAGLHFRKGEWETARELFHESLKRAHEFGTRRAMTASLRGLASLAMASGQPERAAILFGAAASLRETLDTPLLPVWEADFDEYDQQTKAALSEDIYALLAARGHLMPTEKIVSFAVEKI